MDPLSVNKKFILVLSLRQVQDCNKVIVALKKSVKKQQVNKNRLMEFWAVSLKSNLHAIPIRRIKKLTFDLKNTTQIIYLLFRGIFVLQLLKDPDM